MSSILGELCNHDHVTDAFYVMKMNIIATSVDLVSRTYYPPRHPISVEPDNLPASSPCIELLASRTHNVPET